MNSGFTCTICRHPEQSCLDETGCGSVHHLHDGRRPPERQASIRRLWTQRTSATARIVYSVESPGGSASLWRPSL
ncbi:hypothetical protein MRB53_038668 [Persea americana]|nr:hypothetical protein MRB53_038668 [Persea americana]